MDELTAVILAGGFGTRIRHLLPDTPKPLAMVAGKPFLAWIVNYLLRQQVYRVALSTGYLAEKVEAFARSQDVAGRTLTCVREMSPLGTAGGFLNAHKSFQDSTGDALVCNGDSLVLADLMPMREVLRDPLIDAAILAVRVADASRYGAIDVSDDGLLERFSEKRPGAGLVNGGVYLFRRAVISRFPPKRPLSFEYDVFPALLASGCRIKTVPCEAPFLDIGTEESLAQADEFIRKNMEWFK